MGVKSDCVNARNPYRKGMVMPVIGEVRRGAEIGKSGASKFIWHACIGCGMERWVAYHRCAPRREQCHKCSMLPGNRRKPALAPRFGLNTHLSSGIVDTLAALATGIGRFTPVHDYPLMTLRLSPGLRRKLTDYDLMVVCQVGHEERYVITGRGLKALRRERGEDR